MNNISLEFNNVWKKFKKGEKYDSLRDLIPAMAKRIFSGNHGGELLEKEFWSVKDVSFHIKRGEALGIIGPNGAGKSTILKLISGILRPNRGDIKVNGRLSALIEVGAGFHPDLTGRENVFLNGAILGMKRDEIDRKFDEIVEFSGLSEFIDTPVKRYSSGMYARLGFSVAAHIDPEILLVDEVLSVGDAGFQSKCVAKMQEVISSGTTVVFISHNVRQVARLCDNIIVLSHGEAKHLGDSSHALKIYFDLVSGQSRNKYKSISSDEYAAVTVVPVDASVSVADRVLFNTPVYLKVECNLPPALCKANLVIKIGSHDGQDYLVLSSARGNIDLKPGNQKFLCRIDNCRLIPNSYRITAFLTDALTGKIFYSFPYHTDLIIDMPDGDMAMKLPGSRFAVFDVPVTWDVIKK